MLGGSNTGPNMTSSKLLLLSSQETEAINGGGPGTGEAVQLNQDFAKTTYGVPAPRHLRDVTGDPNAWGKFVSGTLSKEA